MVKTEKQYMPSYHSSLRMLNKGSNSVMNIIKGKHAEKIVSSKNISMKDGILQKNTQKRKYVHGNQFLLNEIVI